MKWLLSLSLVFVLVGSTSAATVKYSGIISEITLNAGNSSFFNLVEVGDTVKGNFFYSPNGVTDINDWDAVGQYIFTEFNSSFQLSIFDSSNNGEVLYNYSGRISYILTENNWVYTPNPNLYPTIDAFSPKGLLDNGSEVYLRYQNRNSNLDLITSDELPIEPLSFENYNYTTGSIVIPESLGQIEMDLTELTVIPIPSTLYLLISALLIFAIKKKSLK